MLFMKTCRKYTIYTIYATRKPSSTSGFPTWWVLLYGSNEATKWLLTRSSGFHTEKENDYFQDKFRQTICNLRTYLNYDYVRLDFPIAEKGEKICLVVNLSLIVLSIFVIGIRAGFTCKYEVKCVVVFESKCC